MIRYIIFKLLFYIEFIQTLNFYFHLTKKIEKDIHRNFQCSLRNVLLILIMFAFKFFSYLKIYTQLLD